MPSLSKRPDNDGRHYRKGRRYEQKIVKEAREDGRVAFRSAGSKSPVDVVIIDAVGRTIKLIQAKAGKSMSDGAREALERSLAYLNGTYEVEFVVK